MVGAGGTTLIACDDTTALSPIDGALIATAFTTNELPRKSSSPTDSPPAGYAGEAAVGTLPSIV